MNDRPDEFTPYWLQTAVPSTGEMPGQPVMFPWEYPWPHTAPQTMWPASDSSGSSALPPALASAPHKGADARLRGLMPSNLDPSSLYWPQTATPTGESSAFPASQPANPPWEWPRQSPASPGWDYSAMPMPSAQSSFSNAPVSSTNAAPSWPAYEFDLTQDALRAGAERIGQRGRRAPIPYPAPLPPSPEHVDSAQYWGAGPGPSAASEQSVNGFYLSPVGKAPSWEQVVPTATPWSVSPKLPSPTSWGDVSSGVECDASGGNLDCITPGGRRFTVPAEGLPDGLRIAPGEPHYHYYSTPDGPARFDPSALTQGAIDNPTIGPRRFVRPATPEGTSNEATPGGFYHALIGASVNPMTHQPRLPFDTSVAPVKSYTTRDQNGTPIVVNVTQPGHPLYPGIVIRYITSSPSGSTIQNEGTGLGLMQEPGARFAGPISRVWEGHSSDIIRRMQRDSGKLSGR